MGQVEEVSGAGGEDAKFGDLVIVVDVEPALTATARHGVARTAPTVSLRHRPWLPTVRAHAARGRWRGAQAGKHCSGGT